MEASTPTAPVTAHDEHADHPTRPTGVERARRLDDAGRRTHFEDRFRIALVALALA